MGTATTVNFMYDCSGNFKVFHLLSPRFDSFIPFVTVIANRTSCIACVGTSDFHSASYVLDEHESLSGSEPWLTEQCWNNASPDSRVESYFVARISSTILRSVAFSDNNFSRLGEDYDTSISRPGHDRYSAELYAAIFATHSQYPVATNGPKATRFDFSQPTHAVWIHWITR